MLLPTNRVVVITGGGGELGQALAKIFIATGAAGALLDIAPAIARARALAGRLARKGLALRCDVSHEADVRRAFRTIARRWGRIDILINNAGIEGPTQAAEKVSGREWRRVLEVNLTGAFLCAQAAVPLMKRRGGVIVNIGSVAGRIAYRYRLPYAVSKAALEALTRGLAAELGPYNIRVNLVAPGPVAGARMQRIVRKRARATGATVRDIERSYRQASVLGRLVDPGDVVRMVEFLCSPAAAGVTGQVLEVSAGWTASAF